MVDSSSEWAVRAKRSLKLCEMQIQAIVMTARSKKTPARKTREPAPRKASKQALRDYERKRDFRQDQRARRARHKISAANRGEMHRR